MSSSMEFISLKKPIKTIMEITTKTPITKTMTTITNVRTLRSTVSNQLAVARSRLKGCGDHAFSIAAPRLWNALPESITDCKSICDFKKRS